MSQFRLLWRHLSRKLMTAMKMTRSKNLKHSSKNVKKWWARCRRDSIKLKNFTTEKRRKNTEIVAYRLTWTSPEGKAKKTPMSGARQARTLRSHVRCLTLISVKRKPRLLLQLTQERAGIWERFQTYPLTFKRAICQIVILWRSCSKKSPKLDCSKR